MEHSKIQIGVLSFMPLDTFIDPTHGLDRESNTNRIVDQLDQLIGGAQSPDQSTALWPRVHDAILRQGNYVLEAATPEFKLMLRFSPDRPGDGEYQIRYLPRGRLEKGRTQTVKAVKADSELEQTAMLRPFPMRFTVVTRHDEKHTRRLMWLVGLNSIRVVEEEAESNIARQFEKSDALTQRFFASIKGYFPY